MLQRRKGGARNAAVPGRKREENQEGEVKSVNPPRGAESQAVWFVRFLIGPGLRILPSHQQRCQTCHQPTCCWPTSFKGSTSGLSNEMVPCVLLVYHPLGNMTPPEMGSFQPSLAQSRDELSPLARNVREGQKRPCVRPIFVPSKTNGRGTLWA